ncbi:hypothetical protein CTAYLR_004946 [Chrysophaeum taylorii]|uniref:N-acetyltransferase domain-containing protein n=1 Tax=Chrysophaeum taylorii TaxID=2483200 RepID=A0AAD7UQH2_9STRA|nr:hypothetical protein CTAYLR_004946 [Chrysophaeum taylorii]
MELTVHDLENDEKKLDEVMAIVSDDLSEPYSIFTYRYFVRNWPQLCLRAANPETVAAVLCKADGPSGYIAMLVVRSGFRRFGIGTQLISASIDRMRTLGCAEVFLEAEVTNKMALSLYDKLGFLRDVCFFNYYLNGADAYKLSLRF